MTLRTLGTNVAALNNAYVGRWQASHAYLSGDLVLAPDGTIIQRNANGTSRATYDATEQAAWTVKTAGGGSPLTDVATTATADGAIVAGKHNPVDATSGNRTMTLADATGAGKMIAVSKKDASANTVSVNIAHLRDQGAQTFVMVGQYEALVLVSKADGSWWPIGDHKTKPYLDATYTPRSVAVASNIEQVGTGYPTRPSAGMVIWRGWDDPTGLAGFVANVDLWASASAPAATTFFTNFSTDTIGSPPAAWTSRWAAFASTNIADGGGGTKILQMRKTSGATSMAFLSWDTVPDTADVEIVAKVRCTATLVTATITGFHAPIVRAQGTVDGTDAKGYTGVFHSDPTAVKLGEYKRYPGANANLPTSGSYPNAPGYADLAWNWVRLRINGTTLAVRSWADGSTEPSTWTYSQVESSITGSGKVGLAYQSTGTGTGYDVAAVGVALNGATAPTS